MKHRGDRDQVFYKGFSFGLFEGQFVKGDFGSWRTFVYDYQTGNADQTTIHTDGGSTAFANPPSPHSGHRTANPPSSSRCSSRVRAPRRASPAS